FDKGKYFARGELRYLPDKDRYQLKVQTVKKDELVFEGALKDKKLTLERADEKKNEKQQLVFSFLHSNRFLYQYEVKGADQPLFVRKYQVGVTKEGEAFAEGGDTGPECVVSGGRGTIKVTH